MLSTRVGGEQVLPATARTGVEVIRFGRKEKLAASTTMAAPRRHEASSSESNMSQRYTLLLL